jgi:hypothetical protein
MSLSELLMGLGKEKELLKASGLTYQHASGDFQNLGFVAKQMCRGPKADIRKCFRLNPSLIK